MILMTAPVIASISCTIKIPMLISVLLLPLMQESAVLWVKVSCVGSKHWCLRSYGLQMRSWARRMLLRRRRSGGWSSEEATEAWSWGEHLPNSPLQQLGIHGS